ncbi:MAG: hypothetical protein GY822_09675 [Deltaproteobacteria bacterium]|nr:hypothetical protein [Deltaproteobacteria bacterium]
MTPKERLREQEDLLFQLLFDEVSRERFLLDRQNFLVKAKVSEETTRFFLEVNAFGLEVDAAFRKNYIMSTLCRAFPFTAAAIGASEKGRATLVRFLSSPALFVSTRKRNLAFAEHLENILEFNAANLDSDIVRLLLPFFQLEKARLENATKLRAHVEKKGPSEKIQVLKPPTSNEKERGKVSLPPFFLLGEIPFPQSVLQNALDGVTPQNAWHKIQNQHLENMRVLSVARSLHMPVTLAQRGVLTQHSQSAVSEIPPLIDVTHLAAELNGRAAKGLIDLDGSKTLSELPHSLRSLVTPLVDGGLLILG